MSLSQNARQLNEKSSFIWLKQRQDHLNLNQFFDYLVPKILNNKTGLIGLRQVFSIIC